MPFARLVNGFPYKKRNCAKSYPQEGVFYV